MGCGINRTTMPKVYCVDNKNKISKRGEYNSKEYKSLISQNSWINILDFLNYSDLKEVGKTNKLFNYLVKQNKILVKFFKNKNNDASVVFCQILTSYTIFIVFIPLHAFE